MSSPEPQPLDPILCCLLEDICQHPENPLSWFVMADRRQEAGHQDSFIRCQGHLWQWAQDHADWSLFYAVSFAQYRPPRAWLNKFVPPCQQVPSMLFFRRHTADGPKAVPRWTAWSELLDGNRFSGVIAVQAHCPYEARFLASTVDSWENPQPGGFDPGECLLTHLSQANVELRAGDLLVRTLLLISEDGGTWFPVRAQ